MSFVRDLARSVVATWVVIAAELAVVGVLCRGRISSVWELQYGLLWLSPTVLAACLLPGLVGGALLLAVEHVPDRTARALFGSLGALGGALTGWAVGGGRHLASLPTRGGFALLVGAALATGAAVSVGPLRRAIQRRPGRVAAGTGLLIVTLTLTSRFVLVRLYPAFHHALALAAVLSAPGLTLALRLQTRPAGGPRRPRRRWTGPAVVGLVGILALATARPAAARLAYFDNFRLLLVEEAPLLGYAVRAAALLEPPAPPPTADLSESGLGAKRQAARTLVEPGGRQLDLRGRDLLLVTIDAVRADHVGAYGYRRRTTSELDKLAAEGALFTYAYSPTPHTSYSVSSLMTGKYMRPLLLQGAGQDSDTWAGLLRTYGYRTAAFYPPAVFFIDSDRFVGLRDRYLDFEYRKVEFLEGPARAKQVAEYLRSQPAARPLFVWLHLFGPHEPYEAHPGHDFGERDIDRYDAEIAAADATAGAVIRAFRKRSPSAVVIVSSDHGEEFGEHGGRYHGSAVYEEQVRVPLVVVAPGAIAPRRIAEPVQTIDLLPTMLAAFDIPIPPRVRGRDLGPLLAGARAEGPGLAVAETEEQALLARGSLRLICQRRIGACRLYDIRRDPAQRQDIAASQPNQAAELRERLRQMAASHGRYEVRGLRAEGKHWPAPILRATAGDGDAAADLAALLDDADRSIRRKAAQLLFDLKRPATAGALRLALGRDEDQLVRAWCALGLTRLGQGAPLAFELVKSSDPKWRRLAALALAEAGDSRGADELVAWWKDPKLRDYARSRELLDAFTRIRCRAAVWPLVQSLGDVRLRPHIAAALAGIGDGAARVPLARALETERHQGARAAITKALVKLGADAELAAPLVRFLGVPDPLAGGLEFGLQAEILQHLGGPSGRQLARLSSNSELGAALNLFVPRGGNGKGVRALFLASNSGDSPGQIVLGREHGRLRYDARGRPVKRRGIPQVDPSRALRVAVPPHAARQQLHGTLPPAMGIQAGRPARVVIFADRNVEIHALALVPLADELPPPPPAAWRPGPGEGAAGAAGFELDAGE